MGDMPPNPDHPTRDCTIVNPNHMNVGALRAVMKHIRDSVAGNIPATRAFCWHGAATRNNLIPLAAGSHNPDKPNRSVSAKAGSSKSASSSMKTAATTPAQPPAAAAQASAAGPPKPRRRSPKPPVGKDADSVLSESKDDGCAFNLPASRAGTETPVLGSEDEQDMPDNAPEAHVVYKTSFRTIGLVHPGFLEKNRTVEKLNNTWIRSTV